MTTGYREFEFDLPQALLINLVEAFDQMEGAPLTAPSLASIEEGQGVYQLLNSGQLVYIGKTDAQAGLRKRLERHARTILHRRNLDPENITFKAIRVFVFTAIDLETQLIRHYQTAGRVAWNFSGFGSNDPGRERDTTNARPDGFDAQFPIDLDREISFEIETPSTVSRILSTMRRELPYTLRAETTRRGARSLHPELEAQIRNLPDPPYTMRRLLLHLLDRLPRGWQCTLLPGRVILYKENRDYPFGEIVGRS
jgi:hypothetical protein